MLRRKLQLFVLTGLTAVSSSVAHAAFLPIGGGVLATPTTSAADPTLAGPVIADDLRPFEIFDSLGNVLVKGNVQDRVVRSKATGELIFAPRLRDLSAPNGDAWIMQMDIEGYAGYSIDAAYRVDGLGDTAPNKFYRSVGDGNGVRLQYDPNLLLPPDSAYFPSLHTNARAFDEIGKIEIWASNDFGGNAFSAVLEQTNVPAFFDMTIPGDTNDDRVVDLIDFNTMKKHFGEKGGRGEGDVDGNGVVDLNDFALLKQSFGQNQTTAAVPEPAAAALAAAALVGSLLLRRRR